jgi:hypothetical protein
LVYKKWRLNILYPQEDEVMPFERPKFCFFKNDYDRQVSANQLYFVAISLILLPGYLAELAELVGWRSLLMISIELIAVGSGLLLGFASLYRYRTAGGIWLGVILRFVGLVVLFGIALLDFFMLIVGPLFSAV